MSNEEVRVIVKNLCKSYPLEHASQSVKEAVSKGVIAIFSGKTKSRGSYEELEVFKGISFIVKAGEAVALTGANGAGKSTLLKIVCRIVPPSSGNVLVRGRVAAMLEVGTGFHPELTGRENVFLAAAILGMERKEIEGRFDQIIEFSGVEKHLDKAVKHYSWGMYVRLAFSVAAHSCPDVLIIDEVLAVGDNSFREKCLGKIVKLRDSGVAILFVSHDKSLVDSVATRCIDISKTNQLLDLTS